MCRIDDGLDMLGGKPAGEAIGAAEAADALGYRLRQWACGSPGKRERERKARVISEPPRQLGRFARAAENEYSHDRL
jgi:hypothetical protein